MAHPPRVSSVSTKRMVQVVHGHDVGADGGLVDVPSARELFLEAIDGCGEASLGEAVDEGAQSPVR